MQKKLNVIWCFVVMKAIGTFYEIYGHDAFQYPGCPQHTDCVTTIKTFDPSYKEYGAIYQDFCADCMGGGK